MSQHYCEVDAEPIAPAVMQSLHEACGAPACVRCMGMWMCSKHYDMHTAHMADLGRTPEGNPLLGSKKRQP